MSEYVSINHGLSRVKPLFLKARANGGTKGDRNALMSCSET